LKRDGGGQDRAPTGGGAAGIVSAAGAPAGIAPDAGRLDEGQSHRSWLRRPATCVAEPLKRSVRDDG
jgi:hypothetical protein